MVETKFLLHSKFSYWLASKKIKKNLDLPENKVSKFGFFPRSMTFILLKPVSLQINLADQSKQSFKIFLRW
jgi:hypothetical protein